MTRRTGVTVAVVVALAALIVWRALGPEPAEEALEPEVAVHTIPIGRDTLHRLVTAYGRVEGEPARDGVPAAGAMITPFVDGVVAEIRAVEGRTVSRGDVLFTLDSRLAEIALEHARRQVDFTQSVFDRQERLLSADGTSQRAYQEARNQLDVAQSTLATAQTDLAYLNISSPLSGTVLRLDARVGQHVDASTVLAQVIDLDRLVVTAAVPAREITDVSPGEPAYVGTDEGTPAGQVTVVGRDVDTTTGTHRVQVSVPAGSPLMPGQFTEVRIVVEAHPDVLVVPEESVVTSTEGETWICVVDGTRAVRTPVTAGLREGGLVEVSGDGLREGVAVVTSEAYSLPEETRVQIVGS